MRKSKPFKASEMLLVVSDAIAPYEVVIHGSHNTMRWTPDGGIEEMDKYQRRRIEEAILNRTCNHDGPICGPYCGLNHI